MRELRSLFEKFDEHLAKRFPGLANAIGKTQAYPHEQLSKLASEKLSLIPGDIRTIYQLPSTTAFLVSRGFLPLYHERFQYFLLEPHRLTALSEDDKESLEGIVREIEENRDYYDKHSQWSSAELLSGIRALLTLKLKVLKEGGGNYALANEEGELFFFFHEAPFILKPATFRSLLTDTLEKVLSGELMLNEELLIEPKLRKFQRTRAEQRSRNLLYTLAYEAHTAGNRQDALKWSRESVKLGNDDQYCLIILAESAFFTGDHLQASSVYERIVSISKQAPHPAVYMNYGLCFLRTGDAHRAADIFAQGLEKHPGNVSLMLNLSSAQKRAGDIESALATAMQAHSIDAANDSICYNLACFYGVMNDAQRSAHYLRLAIERNYKWKEEYKRDTDFNSVKASKEFNDL